MINKLTFKAKLILLVEIILSCFFIVFWDGVTVEYIFLAIKQWKIPFNAGSICFTLSFSSLCLVLLTTFFSQALRKRDFLDYGLRKEQWPDFRTFGLLSFYAMILSFAFLFIEISAEHYFHLKVDFPAITSLNSYIWFLFTAIIGGGIREELFFRGYLLNKINLLLPATNAGLWIASIIQILFFCLAHLYQGPLGTIEAFIMAIIFTVIYLRSKSLWNAIIFHSIVDIWGFTLFYLNP